MHDDDIEGRVLSGKYRIEGVLGRGGMGVVLGARHLVLHERVAIKFLSPEALLNGEAVARFEREARAAVRIKSEHVVRVMDVDRLDSGAPYMVMEYLDGEDLAALLRRSGPLPTDQAVEFVLQACVAVADAHVAGIIHRDIKPANLFCVRRSDGRLIIKVLDFGISKLTEPAASSTNAGTKTNTILGSPVYMSPEQLKNSKDVDGRSDIWALGVVLFELLTGRVPFAGQSIVELAVKIATQQPPRLESCRPDAPIGLEAVLARCLEKDREQRYPDVAELSLALLPFASKNGAVLVERVTAIVRGSSPPAPALSATATASEPATLLAGPSSETVAPWSGTKERSGKAAVLGSVAVLSVLVLGLAASALISGGRPAPSSELRRSPSGDARPANPGSSVAREPAPREESPPEIAQTPPLRVPEHAPLVSPVSSEPHKPGEAPKPLGRNDSTVKSSKAGCDPPYIVDKQGRKVFHTRCF
jgi:eukaryotic-like serine/threonine-protein kinase